ncbi:MAG: UDP-N-acetylmuramoyl-L-alanyl-D-glutamate--2,6-diaminopimelate ligase [Gammaproteobacteria bacterium]|nr:UDP-N-acetylmuramoyl-L-alanyl-D-glutamate--2,6-diaminopimelate ligase [Gammaproteobacteria bacterium]
MTEAMRNMSLRQLFAGMDIDVPEQAVADLTSDSRQVISDALFIACNGASHHGLEFLQDALKAGASAIAWEPVSGLVRPELPEGITGIEVPDLSQRLGAMADRFFDAPSALLRVTGITGTNGKTTTAYLVAQALRRIGQSAGYMGTLGYGVNDHLQESVFTTPDCITVHRRLRQLADAGAKHVIAEVSSHALDQCRVDEVRFKVAALTNLTRDHLDYHGDMASYAEAKARLFMRAGVEVAVINVGDRFGAELAGRLERDTELISVAVVDTEAELPEARLRGRIVSERAAGIGVQLSGDFGSALLESALWGQFNGENLAMAAGILLANGIGFDDAVAALQDAVAPPGRMELIRAKGSHPTVVVDFAHTPDALAKALSTVREHAQGDVWCVFGCGGNRDQGKRQAMGEVAAEYADHLIITDDNPRHEDPVDIVGQVAAGIGDHPHCEVIHDRRRAIDAAIATARDNDVVLLAGKGHESVQLVGDRVLPFSDASVAREVLGQGL